MRKRPSQLQLQHVGDLLQRILGKYHIDIHPHDRKLATMWNKAVGPVIAVQTRPEKLIRGNLTVKVCNTVWMHQLQFLKQEILEKLNSSKGGEPIKQIRFVLETNPSRIEGEHLFNYTEYPLQPRDKEYIESSTEAVADQELKDLLRRVMTKDIIRRRLLEKKNSR